MKKRSLILLVTLAISVSMLAGCSSSKGSAQVSTSNQTVSAAPEITQAMLDSKTEEPLGKKDQFKGMTIGFSQRSLAGSEWWENLVRVAKIEADYLGIKLVVLDAQNNLSKQVSDVETLISQGVDSIILNPQHSTGVLSAVKKIHEAKIPLTVVNCSLDPTGAPFTYVSTNVFNSGYKGGMELAKAYDKKYGWKDEVKAVVLSSAPQELESDQRRWGQITGYNDYMLEKYGKSNLKIVSYEYYHWVPEEALNKMQNIIQAHPDIDVIFSACDGGAQGIVPALKSANLLGKVLITSIDGRKTVEQWIKDGDKGIVDTVANDPRLMGKWSVYWAAQAAKGVITPATFYVPNPNVTAENVDKYLDPNSKY